MSDPKINNLVGNYSHLLTQTLVLSTAGIAATITFLQTDAGRNYDFILTILVIASFTISLVCGVVALISLFNQAALNKLELASPLLKYPFRASLIGFVAGIGLFLLLAWTNLNTKREGKLGSDAKANTSMILIVPGTGELNYQYLVERYNLAKETTLAVMILPDSYNDKVCKAK